VAGHQIPAKCAEKSAAGAIFVTMPVAAAAPGGPGASGRFRENCEYSFLCSLFSSVRAVDFYLFPLTFHVFSFMIKFRSEIFSAAARFDPVSQACRVRNNAL
jgi:hypothetical protein